VQAPGAGPQARPHREKVDGTQKFYNDLNTAEQEQESWALLPQLTTGIH